MVAEKVFAVIAESTRRDILEALAQESKAVGQLVDELGVSQPTVSKHLRVLREAGVVTMRAQGQKRFYGINTGPLALVSIWLESLGAGADALAGAAAREVQPAKTRQSSSLAVAQESLVDQPEKQAVSVNAAHNQPVHPAAKPSVPTGPVKTLVNAGQLAATPEAVTGTSVTATAPAAIAGPTPAVAAQVEVHKPANGSVPAVAPATAVVSVPVASKQMAPVVQSNESDGGMPGQIGRSVGRAANKAADLLANLPALPTFRRRKD